MARWIAALACAVSMLAPAGALHAKESPTEFGKQLVQVHELPAEALARFARHDAELKAKGQKPSFMDGGSVDWAASPLALPASGNPYRIVVRVAGSVPVDGDSASVWMAGWSEDGAVRGAAVTGTSSTDHAAGDRVTLTGASGPLSFKEDRNLQPVVMFLGSNNQRIDSVSLEVWSGIGKASFTERLWAWLPLLMGLVFLGVFFWFRRR